VLLLLAVLCVQLLVGGVAWFAGWRTYAGLLIWLVFAVEIGGVAVALWFQRLIFLPLLRISAGLEVLDATPDWRAWTNRARAEEIPPPRNVCGMGPNEALYRQQTTRWAAWTWLDWGLVTAATGIAWWTFSSPELFR
jgi:hypothetical protein